MKRYTLTVGATTNAGGKIMTASSRGSINGASIALEGDALYCPACKSTGKILCIGARIPEYWNDKQVGLGGDLCDCGCRPLPRLYACQTVRYQTLEDDHGTQVQALGPVPPRAFQASIEEAAALPIRFVHAYMLGQLGLGNMTLFLDIYPLHRFFMLRGEEHFATCLETRQSLGAKVTWPVDKTVLAFGKPFKEIKDGFKAVAQNQIAASVLHFARHEQVNVLQAVIYNDFAMRRALDANQFAWATGFPSGVAEAIELTLSARCRPDHAGPLTVIFSRDKRAKLYDQEQRMVFVRQAAERFDKLLHSKERQAVVEAITAIAEGNVTW